MLFSLDRALARYAWRVTVRARRFWALVVAGMTVAACAGARPNVADRARRARESNGYPARYERVARDVRAAREREFRAANPGEWLSTHLDPYGYFTYVTRVDGAMPSEGSWKAPPFTADELAFWRAFLVRNAALFGIADPAIVAGAGDAGGITLEQRFRGHPIAVIQVGRYGPSTTEGRKVPGGTFIAGHHWPRLAEPRDLLDDDVLASHLVGEAGVVELACHGHPCDPAGPETRCPPTPPPVRRSHTIGRDDVRVRRSQRVVYTDRGHGAAEVRVLASLDLVDQPCPPPPSGCNGHPERCPLKPARAVGPEVPPGWALDVATGEVLPEPFLGAAE
jgi:hypothetical protein